MGLFEGLAEAFYNLRNTKCEIHVLRDRSENITGGVEAFEGGGCPNFAIHLKELSQFCLSSKGRGHPDFPKY